MRARKIAILLAVTAISALTIFFVVLADSDAFGGEIAPQYSCGDAVFQGSGGKALVEVLAVLGDGGSGDLRLPLVFGDARDFMILSDPGFLHTEGL